MKKYCILFLTCCFVFQDVHAWSLKNLFSKPSTTSETTTKAEKKAEEAKKAAETAKAHADTSKKDTTLAKAESDAKKAKAAAAKADKAARDAALKAANEDLKNVKPGTEEARLAEERVKKAAEAARQAADAAQAAADEAEDALARFKRKQNQSDIDNKNAADMADYYEKERQYLLASQKADEEYQKAWNEYLETKKELEAAIKELEKDRETLSDGEYESIIRDFMAKEQKSQEAYKNAEKKAEETIDAYGKLGDFYKDYGYVGDPVFIGTGEYIVNYEDYVAQDYLDVFKVTREYISDGYSESFGRNWKCSLDSRIIRCNYADWEPKKKLIEQSIEFATKMIAVFNSYDRNNPSFPRSETSGYVNYAKNVKNTMEEELKIVQKIIDDRNIIIEKNTFCTYGRFKNPHNYFGYHNQLIYLDETGREWKCLYSGNGVWKSSGVINQGKFEIKNLNNSLEESNSDNCDGGYEVCFLDGSKILYDHFGIIVKKTDRNGNETKYKTVNGFVEEILLKTGEIIKISRNEKNNITKISGTTSGSADFVYSDDLLVSAKDNDGISVDYDYMENNLTEIKKDEKSSTYIEYEYNGKLGKNLCSSVTDENGCTESFVYDFENKTVIHNLAEGKSELYKLNDAGNPVYIKDYLNNETKFELNQYGVIIGAESNGIKRKFSYDESFRPVQVLFENGGVTNIIYENDNVVKIIDADGFSNSYEYDNNGNVIGELINNIPVCTYDYYSNGLLQKIYNEKSNVEFEYNNYGSVTKIVEEKENHKAIVYNFEYDMFNRLIKVQENGKETNIEYSEKKKSVKNNKLLKEYYYDDRLRLVKMFTEDLVSGQKYEEVYEYDGKNNIEKYLIDGSLYKERYYSSTGNINSEILWNSYNLHAKFKTEGVKSEPEYNNEGLITRVHKSFITGENNTTENTQSKNVIYETPSGKQIESINGFGITFTSFYDKSGRLIKESFSDGYFINYVYSKAGRILFKTDSDYNKWEYVYKFDGGVDILFSTQTGLVSNCNYDRKGNLTFQNDLINGRYYYFYEDEKLTEVKSSGYIKNNKYDVYGRLVSSNSKDKYTILDYKIEYADDENRVSVFIGDRNESFKEYFLDGRNNIIQTIDKSGQNKYEYDGLGRIVKKIDGKKRVTTYGYDWSNQICYIKYPDESERFITRNQNGNIISVTENGHVLRQTEYDGQNHSISYKDCFNNERKFYYDAAGVINAEDSFSADKYDYPSVFNEKKSSLIDTGITRDFIGNIVCIKNNVSNIEFYYDKAGNLVEAADINLKSKSDYSYDRFGRCTYKDIDNIRYEFEYDECGQLKSIYVPEAEVYIDYEYDCFNREIERKYWNGIVEKTSYNDYGLIESKITLDSIGQILRCNLLIYNDKGKLLYDFNKDGNYNHYEYAHDGKLQAIDYPYSEDLKRFYIDEAIDCGFSLDSEPYSDVLYLPDSIYTKVNSILSKNNLAGRISIPNYQKCLSEKYTYTNSGGVASVENGLGRIVYEYDENNHLQKKYMDGYSENSMVLEWSETGNLISIESRKSSIKMDYSPNNRISQIYSTDKLTGDNSKVSYLYDALGRRVKEFYENDTGYINIYDGVSDRAIKKTPAYKDNLSISLSIYMEENEYRYMNNDDYTPYEDNKYSYVKSYSNADKKNLKTEINLFDGIGVAASKTDGVYSPVISDYKKNTDAKIDVYLNNYGEGYSLVNSIIDLGKRDYIPSLKTFTSEDPVHDGVNWYTYCAGDPVNYIDIEGLRIIPVTQRYLMTDYLYEDLVTGKSTDLENDGINKVGCYVVSYANIMLELYDKGVYSCDKVKYASVYGVNGDKNLFSTEPGHEADMIRDVSMNTVFSSSNDNTDVTWDYFTAKVSGEMRLKVELAKANALKDDYAIMGVFDLSEKYSNVSNHMVVINEMFDENGVFNDITYSSANDAIRQKQNSDVYCVENLKEIRLVKVENKNCGK